MQAINLYYPNIIDQSIAVPGTWNELNASEFLSITKELIAKRDHTHECKSRIAVMLIQSRAALKKIKLPRQWFTFIPLDEAGTFIIELTKFLFDGLDITKQFIPAIRNLKGPADNFDNITCGEFEDAEIFFHAFKKSNAPEDLIMLNAVLWRKRKIAYENYNAEKYKHIFAAQPPHLLYANYLWYSGCRNLLARVFPQFFGGDAGTGEPDTIAFTKCIHAGAGPENGTRQKIRKTLLKEFSLDMELRITRNKEQEKQMRQ